MKRLILAIVASMILAGTAHAVVYNNIGNVKVDDIMAKRPMIDVRALGVKGDGVTDDTTAIQAAINSLSSGILYFPSLGTYVVESITMKNGVYIFAENALFKLKDSSGDSKRLFQFTGVSNSGILGHVTIDGNKANQIYVDDGHGQIGVGIGPGASDLTFGTLIIKDFSQDDLYIGGTGTTPTRIYIQKLVATGATRNPVSITNGDSIVIDDVLAKGATGSAPGIGFDIESNGPTDSLSNIHIGRLETCYNNVHGLGLITPDVIPNSVYIGELYSHHNGQDGAYIRRFSNINVAAGDVSENGLIGIKFFRDTQHVKMNVNVHDNGQHGVSLELATQTALSYDFDFSGTRAYNNGQLSAETYDGIRINSDSAGFPADKINLGNVWAYDDQGVPTQRYGLVIGNNTTLTGVVFDGYLWGNTEAAQYQWPNSTVANDGNRFSSLSQSMIHGLKVGDQPQFFAVNYGNNNAAFKTTETNSLIYGTASSGGGYPFLEAGNLVIQSRPTAARDVVIATGTTPAAVAKFDRSGNTTIYGTLTSGTTGAFSVDLLGKITAPIVNLPNYSNAALSGLANSAVYGTAATGAAYPFLEAGNLVLQSRGDAARDVVVITGSTQKVAAKFDRNQNTTLEGYLSLPVGAPVASNSSMAPSGPIFHVTGTNTINTIGLPYAGFTGCIRIIPDAVFSTGTSGNIAIASTAVVSKVLEMTYDGTKWYPSY
jgi:hypothetical protein